MPIYNSVLRTALFITCYLCLLSPLRAQEVCEAFTKYGIYNTQKTTSDTDKAASFRSWFCQSKFENKEAADAAGLSLGYGQFSLGFDSSNESWSQFSSNYCRDESYSTKYRQATLSFVQTIDANSSDNMLKCFLRDGLHARIIPGATEDTFFIAARLGTSGTVTEATVKSYVHDNATCTGDEIRKGSKIDSAGVEQTCTRLNDEAINIVLTTTEKINWDTPRTLPKIVKPIPPKCALGVNGIDFDGDKCADTYRIENGKMMVKFSKNGRYAQVPSNIPDYNAELGFWLFGDFNGDGVTDLLHMVTKDAGGGRLDYNHVHFSDGNGGFRAPTKFSFPCAANPQCDYNTSLGNWTARDIDSDGKTDLEHNPHASDNRKHCWFSLGDGGFQLRGCPPL